MVYILAGWEVARLVDQRLEAGYHQLIWNGRDRSGRGLPTCMYIVLMVTPQYSKSIKMVLLKQGKARISGLIWLSCQICSGYAVTPSDYLALEPMFCVAAQLRILEAGFLGRRVCRSRRWVPPALPCAVRFKPAENPAPISALRARQAHEIVLDCPR